jgi:hypothetical protein
VRRLLSGSVLAGETAYQHQAVIELGHRGLDLVEFRLHAAATLKQTIPPALEIAPLGGDRA